MPNVMCPRCSSDRLVAGKDDFRVGDALLWGYITGSWIFGALAGSPSSNDLKVYCLSCNVKLEPNEVITQPSPPKEPIDITKIDGLGNSRCEYCNKFMVLNRLCISCGKTQPFKWLTNTNANHSSMTSGCLTAIAIFVLLVFVMLFFTC